MKYDLQRFLDTHEEYYDIAKSELSNGKKQSHYMWFIFPQIKGLGVSKVAQYYALQDIEETRLYMQNEVLKTHMEELLNILLGLEKNDPYDIFGETDGMKFKSCLTLFKLANPDNDIFARALNKFYNGAEDCLTIDIISNNKS